MDLTRHASKTAGHGTMQMPDKPDIWVPFVEWLQQHWPAISGCTLGGFVAALRVIYDGGTRRQMILESLLCGALTLAVSSVLEWMSLPASLASFVGGAIGLIGVERVRRVAVGHLEQIDLGRKR
jgi:lambda family phage holin